jgi:prepilin-type N-terminal cleavage/methylation domain-containing protein
MKSSRHRHRPGFTLTELLVLLVIVAVLALLIFQASSQMIERAKHAVDITRMRQIGQAVTARAFDNNGRAYTKDEIGNSMYREWRDPLSLCQVLEDFLPGRDSWISPAATTRQHKFGNSYAWSVSLNLTSKTLSQIDTPRNTLILWNNFGYTLPSVHGVPEGSTAGPRQAPRQYHYRPWKRGRAVNWYYLDGRIETR